MAVPWIEPETPTPDISSSWWWKILSVSDSINQVAFELTFLKRCISPTKMTNFSPPHIVILSLSPMITHFDSMLVCEVLAIIMVDNLEVLTGDDQGVVVVLVVDHQSVAAEEGKIAM